VLSKEIRKKNVVGDKIKLQYGAKQSEGRKNKRKYSRWCRIRKEMKKE
jgi:hypothetical protein